MTSVVATVASQGRCARTACGWADPVGPDLSLEPRAGRRQRVSGNVFVDVDGLSVLPEVVESREAARAVTLERSFAGVFTAVRLASSFQESYRQQANQKKSYRICLARCSLLVKLR